MKIKMKQWRLITSGTVGGIYAVVSYLEILPIYSGMFMKVFFSLIMVYLAFNSKTIKLLIKQLVIFYLTSFVFGGCAFALLYFVKPQDILMKNGVYIGTYPLKIALLGGIVGFIITHIAFKIVKNKIVKKDMIYQITIIINEKQITIHAMLDTGNLLRDPISKTPVIVVEKNKLESILPNDILDNIDKLIGGEEVEFTNELEEKEILNKIRIIPFSSIGRQNGLLLGIKADMVEIIKDEEVQNSQNAIIGIFPHKLGNNYSAIFGLDLIERSQSNEFVTIAKG